MELQSRKPNRLRDYDYSRNGAYFITICVKDRHEILSRVVRGTTVGDGAVKCAAFYGDVPPFDAAPAPNRTEIKQIQLLEYGIILDKYIRLMDQTMPNISVEDYVIMPNHVHMIVRIETDADFGDGMSHFGDGMSQAPSPTTRANMAIPKFVSLLKRYCNREYGGNIFQRSYHDHIIRDEQDHRALRAYIAANPTHWESDEFYVKR